MSKEQIEHLEQSQSSSHYSDLEKTVIRFAEEWTRDGKASPAVVEKLSKQLSPAALVVLAATVAEANWTNRFNETFGVELP